MTNRRKLLADPADKESIIAAKESLKGIVFSPIQLRLRVRVLCTLLTMQVVSCCHTSRLMLTCADLLKCEIC